MEHFLGKEIESESEYYPVWELFTQRSARLKPLANLIYDLDSLLKPSIRIEALVGSYIHMFINRFLKWNNESVTKKELLKFLLESRPQSLDSEGF